MESAVLLEEEISSDIDAFDIEPADTFEILTASLEVAGMSEMLEVDADYTVFAPTDDAFAKLPKEALAEILFDSQKLKAMLEYHILSGRISADQVRHLSDAQTLEGHPINISTCSKCSKMWINEAEVVDCDLQARNGVIHAIDTVLFP